MITHTAAELARLCGAELEGNGEIELVGVAALSDAGPREVSFLRDARYAPLLETTRAGAVLVPPEFRQPRVGRRDLALLRVENPNRAFSRVVASFRPPASRPEAGIHPQATVHPTAILGAGVAVGARSVVGADVRLADGVVLHPGVVLGSQVEVGSESELFPGVVVYPGCRVGARCILHAGCVIGSDGFGFDPTEEGWEKVPQCGTVVLGDDVEIGANSAVDRGRFGPTRIEDGVKIDNLVHLAHNVVVERGALLAAQVGVAGSSKVRRRAILAGQVGIAGHLEVGPGARVAAQSGVAGSLEGGRDYFGSPAREKGEAFRIEASLRKLPELRRKVLELERRLRELEGGAR